MQTNRHSGIAVACTWLALASTAWAANPIVPGWYADPDIQLFEDEYWIYPTYSDHSGTLDVSAGFTAEQLAERSHSARLYPPFLKQTFFIAFSSRDLIHWTKHSHVLDVKDVSWAAYAVWAPSVIKANGKYFMFFGANDDQEETWSLKQLWARALEPTPPVHERECRHPITRQPMTRRRTGLTDRILQTHIS